MPSSGEERDFAALEPARLARVEDRLRSASALWACAPDVSMGARFGEEIEDLDSGASTVAAEALLDQIARARNSETALRRAELNRSAPAGRFALYRFARSRETGEAEVASRGFFDTRDRPPLMLWLEVVSRGLSGRPGDFDVGILAFVPEACVQRAQAGRRACPNGSLSFLDEGSSQLAMQFAPLLVIHSAR